MQAIDPAGDHGQLGAHFIDSGPIGPAPDHRQPAELRVLVIVLLERGRRGKERRSREVDSVEALRGHADDRNSLAIQGDRLPDDVRIRIERARPERVAEDDRRRGVRRGAIRLGESRADRRPHPEDIEVVAGDQHALDLLRRLSAEREGPRHGVSHDAGERFGAVSIGPVLRHREHASRAVDPPAFDALKILVDGHERRRVRSRQGPQGDVAEDGEDSRIDADSERDRNHRGGSESRIAAERPQGVTGVGPYVRQHLRLFFREASRGYGAFERR